MELLFGMRVEDGVGHQAGTLDRVLVDVRLESVSHVVVRPPEVSEDVLVPLSLVQGAEDGTLRLRVSADELRQLPMYLEGKSGGPCARVDSALAGSAGVGNDIVELGPDTTLAGAEGVRMPLAGVGIETGAPIIDVLYGGNGRERARVPAAWIVELREDVVALDASGNEPRETARQR